eukprot:TRINITY_DN9957_c1_g1_i1.p1 TRINITY_DN9957_c1_g1~~TRINITY_DN9957_c1_g1_i1.p1  ORF type:complete len:346 (+),score=109.82 TRINITY_DN9957_c1_g1_i1:352-1389(+)
MAETKRVRLALCGGGRIGTVHFNDLLTMSNQVQIAAIVEPVAARAKEMGDIAGCPHYATVDELFASTTKFDGVMICTPSGTHTELVKKSLNAGYPVFCEKPIALELHEIDECYALAAEKKLPLLCGFQRRFDPSFMKLKAAIANGQIGEVAVVQTTSRDHPLPNFEFLKTSGGIMHDCASHDIDVHRWLMGAEPVEVFCYGNAFIPEIKAMNDFDTVVITMKWPSGAISTIDLSRVSAYGYDQRIEVLGSKGMVEALNRPRTSFVLSNEKGFQSDPISWSFTDRYPDAYKGEVVHFIEILANPGMAMRVNHADVRNTSIIADAAEESARTGKPVKVDYSRTRGGH